MLTSIKSAITGLFFTLAMLIAVGCGSGAGGEKTIKSIDSSDNKLTITLANASGELKSGDNELVLSFTEKSSGKPVDIKAASLVFHMPGMGAMAEMNDQAALTTTDTPGRFRAHVTIEMAGTWEARIGYEGQIGSGQASFNVQAK
ncbi:MAG TPA: FixH family protein [Blastocatellia bacterium]|nr:FixH family protein [Blastocatellia bacterium]